MKIKGGYYIKARKIQESIIATAPPYTREIWDWLLKEANHKGKKYGKFTIKRGQLFRTYKEIREGLAWFVGYRKMMYNENHTKKAMKFLRKHLMIDTTKELGGVLITICNYSFYQDPKNYERTNESPIERTNKEPMKNHPLPDNNKNVKNDKNEKKKKNKYLDYVFLTKEEHLKLIDKFGEYATDNYIENLNDYIGSKGKKYKSHYHTILMWAKKDNPKNKFQLGTLPDDKTTS